MTEIGELLPEVREEKEPTTVDSFCHIVDGSGEKAYCGYIDTGPLTCKPYNGEAICPSCGLPTCPTCAVMASLNERLEELE